MKRTEACGDTPVRANVRTRVAYVRNGRRKNDRRRALSRYMGASLTMIDRHYGHLARDGREHATRLPKLVPDRFGESTGEVDLGDLGAALFADARFGRLVAGRGRRRPCRHAWPPRRAPNAGSAVPVWRAGRGGRARSKCSQRAIATSRRRHAAVGTRSRLQVCSRTMTPRAVPALLAARVSGRMR
jgi:hypothetical protein